MGLEMLNFRDLLFHVSENCLNYEYSNEYFMHVTQVIASFVKKHKGLQSIKLKMLVHVIPWALAIST